MVAKKVLILFSLTSLVNLGTYEDFNEENPKKSIVEEDISITENNWNTRKWGSIYFLVRTVPVYVFYKILQFRYLKSNYSFDKYLIIKNYMNTLIKNYKYQSVNDDFIYFPNLIIGEGTFGVVVFGIKIENNIPVAVKVQKRAPKYKDLIKENTILNRLQNYINFPNL